MWRSETFYSLSIARRHLLTSLLGALGYLDRVNQKKERDHPGSGIVGGAGGLKGDGDPRWRFML